MGKQLTNVEVDQLVRDGLAFAGYISDAPPVTSRVEAEKARLTAVEQLQPFALQVIQAERAIIQQAIDLCLGNREEAAMRLGIGRTTLYRKMGRKV